MNPSPSRSNPTTFPYRTMTPCASDTWISPPVGLLLILGLPLLAHALADSRNLRSRAARLGRDPPVAVFDRPYFFTYCSINSESQHKHLPLGSFLRGVDVMA